MEWNFQADLVDMPSSHLKQKLIDEINRFMNHMNFQEAMKSFKKLKIKAEFE